MVPGLVGVLNCTKYLRPALCKCEHVKLRQQVYTHIVCASFCSQGRLVSFMLEGQQETGTDLGGAGKARASPLPS